MLFIIRQYKLFILLGFVCIFTIFALYILHYMYYSNDVMSNLISYNAFSKDSHKKYITLEPKPVSEIYNEISLPKYKDYNFIFLNAPLSLAHASGVNDKRVHESFFIKMLLPLVLRVDEQVRNEKKALFRLYNRFNQNRFNQRDIERLLYYAKKYNEHVTLNYLGYLYASHSLYNKVGRLPISITLAIAIIESKLGSSVALYKYNSLFNNWRVQKKTTFSTLQDSIREFYFTLNADNRFFRFRSYRHDVMVRREDINSPEVKQKLILLMKKYNSYQRDYCQNIMRVMKAYKLSRYDNYKLMHNNGEHNIYLKFKG